MTAEWSLTKDGKPITLEGGFDGTLTNDGGKIRFYEVGEYVLQAAVTDSTGRSFTYTAPVKVYPVITVSMELTKETHTDKAATASVKLTNAGSLPVAWSMINQGKLYQAVTEKSGYTFQNCAFVGFDENNRPRYCALRSPSESSSFRQDVENSDKTYGFCMDRIQTLAKSTAVACGICSDKPYDEETAVKLSNNLYRLNEHNGVVLACKHHPLFEYVLSTYRCDENKNPIQRQYFYNKEDAFESFATRSGLIDEKRLFSETDLKVIYAGLVKMRTIDNDMDIPTSGR